MTYLDIPTLPILGTILHNSALSRPNDRSAAVPLCKGMTVTGAALSPATMASMAALELDVMPWKVQARANAQ